MYGPLCWQRCDHDSGGYKKSCGTASCRSNCKVSSTCANDDCAKDAAFTHQKHGDEGQGKVSQLDFIIKPKDRPDDCLIFNEGKLWDTRDHYPIYARIEEGRDTKQFPRKPKTTGVDGHPRRWNIKSNVQSRRMMEQQRPHKGRATCLECPSGTTLPCAGVTAT